MVLTISSSKAAVLRRWIRTTAFLALIFISALPGDKAHGGERSQISGVSRPGDEPNSQGSSSSAVFLPVLARGSNFGDLQRRVNLPHFDGTVKYGETAVFWFGRVSSSDNYADVRMGYSNTELYVHLNIIDKQLWYDKTPAMNDLTDWDSVSLYLDLDGPLGSAPGGNSYRFDGQLSGSEGRVGYDQAYQWGGGNWQPVNLSFSTESFWRGKSPNDNTLVDSGWWLLYHIPFDQLGLSGPPQIGTEWGLGFVLHDRDQPDQAVKSDKIWPELIKPNQPDSWGTLNFGLPSYQPAAPTSQGKLVIRDKKDGVKVVDGEVGGGALCGQGLGWDTWGETSSPGKQQISVQNQFDVSDWPCFTKIYLSFPLAGLPVGKTVVSATLTMFHFGNAGGGEYGEPPISLIQVSAVGESWDENTLTWNNAPLASENVSRTWVEPIGPEISEVPREWDVSSAAQEAYLAGEPLRLVLYSADAPQHTGKYFWSSDTGDWNSQSRPTLTVSWGEP